MFNYPLPRQGLIWLNFGRFGVTLPTCLRCSERYKELSTPPRNNSRSRSSQSTSRPTSQDVTTSRSREDAAPASEDGRTRTSGRSLSRGIRRRSLSVQWAEPIKETASSRRRGKSGCSSKPNTSRERRESPSPQRHRESVPPKRRRHREAPYAQGKPDDQSGLNSSSPRNSLSDDSLVEGVTDAVAETLRLIDEVRDLPSDIRDSILRQTFCRPNSRSSRSRTRRQ